MFIIGVPSEITQVEKRAVVDSAYRAKASEVHLVEQAMVAAIGAGLPITEQVIFAVKKAVVGTGGADKTQVQMMVRRLLPGASIRRRQSVGILGMAA